MAGKLKLLDTWLQQGDLSGNGLGGIGSTRLRAVGRAS
jgi:hypothetical protein